MTGIGFRGLGEETLPDVLDTYNYYVMNTTATFHIGARTPEEMRKIIFYGGKYRAFAVLENGRFCGYVHTSPYSGREAYTGTAFVTVYLRDDCTGRGIGSLALRHIEQSARESGIRVLIAAVTGTNEKSIRLFEKNGYVRCGYLREVGRKFGQTLDVAEYQKILSGTDGQL